MFLDRVIHLGETCGDQVKGGAPKELKLLNEDHNVVHVKEQVLRFNVILLATPQLVLSQIYSFRGQFGRS